MIRVNCSINNKKYTLNGHSMDRLLDVLRDTAGLTGTKEGCGEGECGACSVLINGELVNSCLVPLSQVDGVEILTVESLASSSRLHPIQEAFLKFGGAQCGACTPGMLMATAALLEKNNQPSETEIREALAGNLCRCTGYTKIFESVANVGPECSL